MVSVKRVFMEFIIGFLLICLIIYLSFFRGKSINVEQYRAEIEEMILISLNSGKAVVTKRYLSRPL